MSRKLRLMLSIVVLVVIVAAAWFFLLSPLRADIAETNETITAQQEKLTIAQAKLAKAQTTRAEGKKNQARLLELAKMVPLSTQVPSLLVQIQDLADQAGIEFLAVSPGEPSEVGGFQIVPLQVQFTGSYFDLSDFAYRVEQLVASPGRLMTVKSIQFKLGGAEAAEDEADESLDNSPTLNVSMTLYAFCMDQTAASGATASSGKTGSASSSSADTTSAN